MTEEFETRLGILRVNCKNESLENHIKYLDFIIGYMRREARWMAQMARANMHKHFNDQEWCNRMCVDIHVQRNTRRGFEAKRDHALASMAIQEICLNREYGDFGTHGDVLRMIRDLVIT